jgi:hypothetical protein
MTTSTLAAYKNSFKIMVEKYQVSIPGLLVDGQTWPSMVLEVLA